jgi:3-oxoacyl-[acyl-carrier protein] reductase
MIEGKVAFITGSTRGIGWATAKTFAGHGAKVILNGRNDEKLLQSRIAEIKAEYGIDCDGIFADVSNADEVKKCYQEIFKRYKRLDILVNNAGILQDALLGMISTEVINETFAVNAIAPLYNLQEAARLMSRNQSGSVINISSIIAARGNVGQALYAASKAALIGMTLSAAKELAPSGIRVNAVLPGFIDTDMARSLSEEKFADRIASIKMGRIGTPYEVANVITFLASDLASYVTGQIVGVDGGMLI